MLILAIALAMVAMTPVASAATCYGGDREALLKIKGSIKADPSGALATWSTSNNDSDCCAWDGITCNKATGRVTALRLINTNTANASSSSSSSWYMSGKLSPAVGSLTALRDLRINGWHRFSGSIPSEIGGLTQLSILMLANDGFSHEIPATLLTNLTALRRLSLRGNRLTGTVPQQLQRLTRLELLDVSHNAFYGPLPQRLPAALTCFDGSYNTFVGPIPAAWANNNLTSTAALSTLLLRHNNLTYQLPTWVGSLTSLVTLELGYNFFFGRIPVEFGNLHNVSRFGVEHNYLCGHIPLPQFPASAYAANRCLCGPPLAACTSN